MFPAKITVFFFFFFQAEDGIRYLVRSRGLGDVYKTQAYVIRTCFYRIFTPFRLIFHLSEATIPP